MTETQLKDKVLVWLKKTYPNSWFYKTSDKFQSGIPDIIGCVWGRFVAMELKIPGGKLSKIQKFILVRIESAGGLAEVCYNLTEVKKFLKEKVICEEF